MTNHLHNTCMRTPAANMEFNKGGEAREMRDLQAHVWNQTLNHINSMSLKCAIELGILDIVHNHGRPMTLPNLVSALGIPQAKAGFLHRLMRILTHSGFFARQKVKRSSDNEDEEEAERYVLAPPSQLLLKDNPVSMYPMVTFQLHPFMTLPFCCLSRWFHSDSPISPFEMQYGKPCWDCTLHDPEYNHLTNEAMASDAPIVMTAITEKCRKVLEESTSVVDVGGGTGHLARTIADAFPHLELTVLDLPHVVRGLEGTKNLKFLEGDMFKYIPPASIILLKWILHNWNDEDALKILRRCKEAITAGGKVIIIELVVGEQEKDKAWIETELLFDMLMMMTVAGKERSEKEWAKLFLDAGFGEYRITPVVGSRCLIEVHP